MRALVQRATQASVTVDGEVVGQIDDGMLIFFCATQGDEPSKAVQLAAKISKLRIFKDDADKMNLSIKDTGGSALIVSQFTLAADVSRGNRPGFSYAAAPEDGLKLYELFIAEMQKLGVPVATGRFGAEMAVSLTNNGPATIWYDI